MQDAPVAAAPGASPAGLGEIVARRRRRLVLVVCAAVAIGLHLILFGGTPSLSFGSLPAVASAPMSIRTVEATTPSEPKVEPVEPLAPLAPVATVALADPVEAVAAAPPSRVSGERSSPDSLRPEATLRLPPVMPPKEAGARIPAKALVADSAASAVAVTAAAEPLASRRVDNAASSLLAPGEEPPPVYPTRLPNAATLHYQVRRGGLAGTGDIRWMPSAEGYRLVLESSIAGLVLLRQTSAGTIDADGLAPTRFLDERARRGAQAANFRRDAGRVTFSGPAVEWPLLPGSQDRLSWMIQLAGIAAAAPERLVEGGRIAMIVVGARGEASLWTLRCAGREVVETIRGHVPSIKLVRDGRSTYDTSAEIWLDPERDYLPVRATLRNGPGDAEFDLLLERLERP